MSEHKYVNLDTVSIAWLSIIWTVLGATPVPIFWIFVLCQFVWRPITTMLMLMTMLMTATSNVYSPFDAVRWDERRPLSVQQRVSRRVGRCTLYNGLRHKTSRLLAVAADFCGYNSFYRFNQPAAWKSLSHTQPLSRRQASAGLADLNCSDFTDFSRVIFVC